MHGFAVFVGLSFSVRLVTPDYPDPSKVSANKSCGGEVELGGLGAIVFSN